MQDETYTVAPDRARVRARHNARFIADWREHCRPLDRNERAKVAFLAEALERRSKMPGRRNGVLGYVGLAVLRAMLFGFINRTTGLLCPSYDALQKATGLCRQSIAKALASLESAGILVIARRLCRQWVDRVSPITGQPERIMTTTQATNLYRVKAPGAWADHLPRNTGKRRPFPSPRQVSLLERMELTWRDRLVVSEPSASGREKPPAPGAQPLAHWLSKG